MIWWVLGGAVQAYVLYVVWRTGVSVGLEWPRCAECHVVRCGSKGDGTKMDSRLRGNDREGKD